MSIKILKHEELRWINIDKAEEVELDYLRKNFSFHPLDLEDITSESQTPKIDTYKNYLFLILQFPVWDTQTQTISSLEIDIFLGDTFLVTVQHLKSKEMKTFFYRCLKNKTMKKNWMSKDAGYLLYRLLEALYKESQPILNQLGKQITDIEQKIYSGNHDAGTVRQLALYRRNILTFRRILDPQRYLMSSLSHTRKSFLHEDLALYYDNINDYLSKLWSIVESYKETISGLHITVESLINQRTNKVISSLTAISVSLMPLTLLSGIYGMNIDNLPFAHNPMLIWYMFLGLSITIILVIILMQKRKWL